ncbi:hypothetical protein BDV24DRAFT_175408 [Aspergillus arachidicola]|uniref:TauD/TfdA-like domain-containing protein n=1 Tax=Aspergillus arachidicola TaxID=656916 RepID=A0A5N6Y9H5_9EURO|nr:hypothetical protein BDV24DRAFT_175408 [Aspergillus arachidicola]
MTVPVASKPQSHARIHSMGSLDGFKPTMLTPVIGNEFVKGAANIVDDILRAPNADQRIRDLAKELITKMGKLTIRPPDHGLHTHPIYMSDREFSDRDAEISTIDSAALKKPAPADFTSLRLTKLPETGGDTLWASGYDMYDRISKPYRTFLETLTATHVADGFHRASAAGKFDLYEKPRGSPLNVGVDLGADHPIVRTNPITGWKSIYAVGFPGLKKVNGLTVRESENMFNYFHDMITYGHDLQYSTFFMRPLTILTIWDNRSAFHCATFTFDGFGDRSGNRAVRVGEVPYFDPSSKSRREDLGIEDTVPPFHW